MGQHITVTYSFEQDQNTSRVKIELTYPGGRESPFPFVDRGYAGYCDFARQAGVALGTLIDFQDPREIHSEPPWAVRNYVKEFGRSIAAARGLTWEDIAESPDWSLASGPEDSSDDDAEEDERLD